MKNYLLIIAISFAITQTVYSQTKDSCYAGVYLTKDDFIKNLFSYKINEDIKGNKLEFAIPADLTLTIKIVTQDSILRFKPGVIYGYYECGAVFRYFQGGELNVQEDYYKIEEAKDIIIYSSVFISGPEIFYSINLTSPIHRLTMKNLEKDFNDYPEFINSIKKINDRVDGGIAARDDKGAFIINKIAHFAQEDFLKKLDTIGTQHKPINKVAGTFISTKIINLQTIAIMSRGDLDFCITHRFGNMGVASNGGFQTFYGWDDISDVRFAFDYGITDKLQIGIARNAMMGNIDASLKWRFLEQTIDNKIPLSIAVCGIASLTPMRESKLYSGADSTFIANENGIHKVIQDRIVYTTEIIFARKFGNRLSFEIVPMFTHRDYVLPRINTNNNANDEKNIFSIGTGIRLKLTKNISIAADYIYIISAFRKDNPTQSYYNPLAIGIEIGTGGHVFHINLTNASGIIENYFIPNTTDSWLKGGYKLGFNISRVFPIVKSKKHSVWKKRLL